MDQREDTTGSQKSSEIDPSKLSMEEKLARMQDKGKKKKQDERQFRKEQKRYFETVGLCSGLVEMMFIRVSSSQFNNVPIESLMYQFSYDQFIDHANRIQYQENNLFIAEEKQRREEELAKPRMPR
jgi:tartrate dehydratase beta subunit/fumarate hydratase class I family protein